MNNRIRIRMRWLCRWRCYRCYRWYFINTL